MWDLLPSIVSDQLGKQVAAKAKQEAETVDYTGMQIGTLRSPPKGAYQETGSSRFTVMMRDYDGNKIEAVYAGRQ